MNGPTSFVEVLLAGGATPTPVGGLTANVLVFAVAFGAGYLLAVPLALARYAAPRALVAPLAWGVGLVRGLPVLLLAFWANLVWPLVTGAPADALVSVSAALTVYAAVYLSDMLLTGARAVPQTELEAARALGLGVRSMLFALVLPQMLRRSIASVASFATSLFKDTSILYIVGVSDVLHLGMIAAEREPSRFAFWYLLVAASFIAVCQVLSALGRLAARRFALFGTRAALSP